MDMADVIVQPNNQNLVETMAYGVAAFTVVTAAVDRGLKIYF